MIKTRKCLHDKISLCLSKQCKGRYIDADEKPVVFNKTRSHMIEGEANTRIYTNTHAFNNNTSIIPEDLLKY